MIYFVTNNSLSKKIIFSTILVIIFIVGLFLLYTNRGSSLNFKSYYIQSSAYILEYQLNQLIQKIPFVNTVKGEASSVNNSTYAESIPVLLYHGVLGGPSNNTQGEATNIDLANFWDQMKTLKENGWQTVSMTDFYSFMQGQKKLPAKSFLLTFDDGRKDSYYPADPLLKTLGFHAVMFAIEKYSVEENSNYYMSKAELQKMEASPEWEVQSHGYSSHSNYPIDGNGTKGHFFSNELWIPELGRVETTDEFIARTTDDLTQAKTKFEQLFNKPIIAFAFPFGDYGGGTINFPGAESIIVPEVTGVYPLTFYQYSNIYRYSQNYPNPDNPTSSYMVKRIGINTKWSGKDLLSTFESGNSKPLPFFAKFDNSDGWINTNWGEMSLADNKLTISSSPNGTGSTVALDGSNAWTDYTITAQVTWVKGSNIYLSARYKDDNNLVACNFNKNLVHVEQVINGQNFVIAGVVNNFDPGNNPFTVAMTVKGRSVDCSINQSVVVSDQFIDPSLSRGGVGIKTWDSTVGNSELVIDNFSVASN